MTTTLIAYRTPPNYEKRAAEEIEQQGATATVPWDDSGSRVKVTAPGYVFSSRAVSRAFTKHVREYLGRAPLADVANLYIRKEEPIKLACPYTIGQPVSHGIVPATVAGVEGEDCMIAFTMAGKQHVQIVHYSQIRPA